eukprot:scaffold39875_cov38-Attheya_sp.AAC.1
MGMESGISRSSSRNTHCTGRIQAICLVQDTVDMELVRSKNRSAATVEKVIGVRQPGRNGGDARLVAVDMLKIPTWIKPKAAVADV